jgi:hypothetical protein
MSNLPCLELDTNIFGYSPERSSKIVEIVALPSFSVADTNRNLVPSLKQSGIPFCGKPSSLVSPRLVNDWEIASKEFHSKISDRVI